MEVNNKSEAPESDQKLPVNFVPLLTLRGEAPSQTCHSVQKIVMPHSGSNPFSPENKVELRGLKATTLNGRRGRVVPVAGAATPKKGPVAVLLDGSVKAKSVEFVNLKATPSACGGCDKPGALSKCAGCMRVAYCSKNCQVQHWKKGGHKRECKQLKLGAAPTDQPIFTGE